MPRDVGALVGFRNVCAGQILFCAGDAGGWSFAFPRLENTVPLIPSKLSFHEPLADFTGAPNIAVGNAEPEDVSRRMRARLFGRRRRKGEWAAQILPIIEKLLFIGLPINGFPI